MLLRPAPPVGPPRGRSTPWPSPESLAWPTYGQLRHQLHRRPVCELGIVGDPAGPVRGLRAYRVESVDMAVATLIHTDVGDWAAVVAEARRVLRPGGRFCYVGVHPCFVGPFAKRDGDTVRLHPGYRDHSVTFTGPGPGPGVGIRSRIGVWHRTLTELLDAVTGPGLQLLRVAEYETTGPVPGLLGIVDGRG